ncbi:hypothetical protein [Spirosoma horti]
MKNLVSLVLRMFSLLFAREATRVLMPDDRSPAICTGVGNWRK